MQRSATGGGIGHRVTATGLGAVVAAGLAGCAEFRISDSELARITSVLEDSLTLSVCEPPTTPAPGNKTIDIQFVEESPGVWCPKAQVEACPQVYQSDKVQWRSVRKNGDGAWEPFPTRFKVYLTPFNGDAFPAANGETGLRSLNADAPPGVYKYTVWDWPASGDHVCKPLDPNFHVNL